MLLLRLNFKGYAVSQQSNKYLYTKGSRTSIPNLQIPLYRQCLINIAFPLQRDLYRQYRH